MNIANSIIVINGDIIELKMDRTQGVLSMRIFRNQKWTDYLEMPVVSSSIIGGLNFGIGSIYQGTQISLVDKPNEWPVKS